MKRPQHFNANVLQGIPISTEPPSDGDLLLYDASGRRLVFGQPSQPPAWKTGYSVDFTALATGGSTVLSNGAQTIDGKTWYVENASAADELRVVHGEGLVIDPNSTSTDYYSSTRTCPNVQVKLTNLSSQLNVNDVSEIRVWCLIAASNIDNNFETIMVGLTKFQSQQQAYCLSRANVFVVKNFLRRTLDDSTWDIDLGTSHITKNVFVLRWRGGNAVDGYVGNDVSGAFPSSASLVPLGTMTGESSGTGYAFGPSRLTSADDLAFIFTVYPVNTTNAVRGSLKKLLIEYR